MRLFVAFTSAIIFGLILPPPAAMFMGIALIIGFGIESIVETIKSSQPVQKPSAHKIPWVEDRTIIDDYTCPKQFSVTKFNK